MHDHAWRRASQDCFRLNQCYLRNDDDTDGGHFKRLVTAQWKALENDGEYKYAILKFSKQMLPKLVFVKSSWKWIDQIIIFNQIVQVRRHYPCGLQLYYQRLRSIHGILEHASFLDKHCLDENLPNCGLDFQS